MGTYACVHIRLESTILKCASLFWIPLWYCLYCTSLSCIFGLKSSQVCFLVMDLGPDIVFNLITLSWCPSNCDLCGLPYISWILVLKLCLSGFPCVGSWDNNSWGWVLRHNQQCQGKDPRQERYFLIIKTLMSKTRLLRLSPQTQLTMSRPYYNIVSRWHNHHYRWIYTEKWCLVMPIS